MTNNYSILLVDDDDDLREALAEQLGFTDKFNISEANSVASAIDIIQKKSFDIMLLDIQLPDGDGLELCKLIRRRGVQAPIIMLTAQSANSDVIIGLDSGANDYVVKPFHFRVLLSRIEAQLRSQRQFDDKKFTIGENVFYPAKKAIINKDNQKIPLTEKETKILRILCISRAQVISREVLLSEVWNYSTKVSTHTLETHIYRLRRKIHSDLNTPDMLITESGGYKLLGS